MITEPVTIEPIAVERAEEIAGRMPWRQATRHVERARAQRSGLGLYLVARDGEEPIGHSFVKWPGELSSREALAEGCAEVEDLYVAEDRRNRGVGRALLVASEAAARERGLTTIGLAVGVGNAGARRLYARHGYRDAGHGVFILRWTRVNERGRLEHVREECMYLVKDMASRSTAGTG